MEPYAVQYDIILGKIPPKFTFTSVYKALELIFRFLGNKNDNNETVCCDINPRWDMQSVCYDGFIWI